MTLLMYVAGLTLISAIAATIHDRRSETIRLLQRKETIRRVKKRGTKPWNPYTNFIRQAEMANFPIKKRTLLVVFGVIPGFILMMMITTRYSIFFSIVLLVVYQYLPSWIMRMRVTSYHRRFRRELKDDIHLGTSVLRIGDTLENTFKEIAEHGSGRITRQVFADIVHDHIVLQRPLLSVLGDYANRLNISEFNTFYLLTKVGITSGGNLFVVWERLSHELERLFAFESAARAKGISMTMMSYAFFVIEIVLFFFVLPWLLSHDAFIVKIIVYVLFAFSFGAFFVIRAISKTRV